MTAVLKGKQTRIILFWKTGKETDLRGEVSWILQSRMTTVDQVLLNQNLGLSDRDTH